MFDLTLMVDSTVSGYRNVLHPNEQLVGRVTLDRQVLRLRGNGWPEMRYGELSESEYQDWLRTLRSKGLTVTEAAA
jgi:hypothetical protein